MAENKSLKAAEIRVHQNLALNRLRTLEQAQRLALADRKADYEQDIKTLTEEIRKMDAELRSLQE